MLNFRTTISISILLLCLDQSFAQTTINLPGNGFPEPIQSDNVVASEVIFGEEVTTISPSSGNTVRLYIDKTISNNNIYQPNLNLGNGASGTPIDMNLPVGSIVGSANVTPYGQATYSIPFYIPPGSNGMVPSLGLTYNSMAHEGIAGRGWNINGISAITRSKSDFYHDNINAGISLTNNIYSLDGQRMVYSAGGGCYYTENYNLSHITTDNGAFGFYFKVRTKEGLYMEYGNSSDSRLIVQPSGDTYAFYLSKVYDESGNYMLYIYNNEDSEVTLTEVKYTGTPAFQPYNSLKFYYDIKPAISTNWINDNIINNSRILREVEIFTEGVSTMKYSLKYASYIQDYLNEIIQYGSDNKRLNSTYFGYGDQAALPNPSAAIICGSAGGITTMAEYRTGDFNGDGLADLLGFPYSGVDAATNRKLHTGWELFLNDGNGAFYSVQSCVPCSGFFPYGFNNYFGLNPQPGIDIIDINADGYDDMFLLKNVGNYTEFYVYYSNGNGFNSGIFIKSIPSTRPYTLFDVNGDHIPELVDYDEDFEQFIITDVISGNDYSNNYTNISSVSCASSGQVDFNYEGISAYDLDGDGNQELLASRNNKQVVLQFTIINQTTNPTVTGVTEIYCTTPNNLHSQHYFLDYNGDNITDIMKIQGSVLGARVKYGTGSDYTGFQDLTGTNPFSENSKYLTTDINHDGKMDVIYLSKQGNPKRIEVRVVYGGKPDATILIGQIPNKDFPDVRDYAWESEPLNFSTYGTLDYELDHEWIPEFLIADFDGDGNPDLFFKTGDGQGTRAIAYFNNERKTHLLTSVTDGFRNITNFYYKTLAKGGPDLYVKGSGATHPLIDFKGNMFVVSKMVVPDGIGGTSETDYKYEGAKVHVKSKGFLGFEKNTASNLIQNSKVVSEYRLDGLAPGSSILFYDFLPELVEVRTLDNNGLISSKNFDFSFILFGTSKIKITKLDVETETNHLSGIVTTKTNTYDVNNLGILINSVTNVANGLEIITEDISLEGSPQGSWVAWKPVKIIKTNTRQGEPAYVRQINYSYDPKGRLLSVINDSGMPKELTKSFVYNPTHGFLEKTIISASGLPTKTSEYFYDDKFRFIIKSKNPLNQESETSYDSKWGKPLWTKTVDGLFTHYAYDGFGRDKKIIPPDGIQTDISYNWIPVGSINGTDPIDVSGSLYEIIKQKNRSPLSKVYFDSFKRVTRSQVQGFSGMVYSAKTYNTKGLVNAECQSYELPLSPGKAPIISTFEYDTYNRLTDMNSSDGNVSLPTTYEYEYNSGNFEVTTTTPDNNTFFKSIDPTGLTVLASDNGGDLTYTYFSNRQLKNVSLDGVEITKFEYDEYGRQNKLDEKNSGITTYEYNAYGELDFQNDLNNNQFDFSYNELGLLLTRTGTVESIAYNYVTSGNGLNQLSSIVSTNGVSYNYEYDSFGRLIEMTEDIQGQEFVKSIEYDTYGNIIKKIFPGNFEIEMDYNSDGYHSSTRISGTNQMIWQLDEVNPMGQPLKYTLGNNVQTQNQYTNFGLPTTVNASGIFEITTDFDPESQNLNYRVDHLKNNISEGFNYDPLNRLSVSQVLFNPPYSVTYEANGNISTKTDIGSYTYDPVKLNAVSQVTNPASLISLVPQTINYNSMNKVSDIYEGSYSYNIIYGPDDARKKSVLINQGNTEYTRYYIGNYEKTISGNQVAEIYYLDGGALYVVINGLGTVYFTYTDHLGSIIKVTDQNGVIVAEQNFDAWGNKRNADNWNYSNIPPVEEWLYRGFTGHEHLPEFGLINMNGRMYDPNLGRMLSPDNFVQAPDFTQSYNRYSYAWNNPLKFTDPDGNYTILALGLFILGSSMDHVFNMGYYEHDNIGDAFKAGFNDAYNAYNQINSVASVSVYQDDHWNASVGLSLGGLGATASVTYTTGDWSIGASLSASYTTNPVSGNSGIGTAAGGGVSYYDDKNNIGFSFGFVGYGGVSENQALWTGGFRTGDFSLTMSNDAWVSGDKFRTGGVELSVGQASLGMSLYTTEPPLGEYKSELGKSENSKFQSMWDRFGKNDNPHGTYSSGSRVFAGLYFGYRSINSVSRIGVDAPWVQDFFQNGIHKYITRSPYFDTTKGPPTQLFYQDIMYSKWSLY